MDLGAEKTKALLFFVAFKLRIQLQVKDNFIAAA